jgi:hypothetical protein
MRALTLGTIAVACLGLTAGAVMLAAGGQQSRPGEIGENHVVIDNRPDQAIPVLVQRSLQVSGTVTIDPAKAVGIRAVRQSWEYRTITVGPGKDPAGFLGGAGLDGWEAVGFQSGPGGVSVLLKRPR